MIISTTKFAMAYARKHEVVVNTYDYLLPEVVIFNYHGYAVFL